MKPYTIDLQRQIATQAHAADIHRLIIAGVIKDEETGQVLMVRHGSSKVMCGHSWSLPQSNADSGDLLDDIADELFARYLGKAAFGEVGFCDARVTKNGASLLVPAAVTVDSVVMRDLLTDNDRKHISPGQESVFGPVESDSAHVLEALGGFSFR